MDPIHGPFEAVERAHQEGDPHLVREIFRAYQALLNAFSPRVGMPAARLALVRLLAVSGPDGLAVTEAARSLGVHMAAVTRQLQWLERRGWVRRRRDAADKRRCYVRLSQRGFRVFQEAHQRSHEWERALAGVLGVERMKSAAAVLAELRQHLETGGGPVSEKEERR